MIELIKGISLLINEKMSNIHTCIPAKITEIDMSTLRAKVKPEGKIVLADGTQVDYPIVADVPVLLPTFKGLSFAFPINEGDDCLLLFAEQSLDKWKNEGESYSRMKFSITDAIALIGFSPNPDIGAAQKAKGANRFVLTGDVEITGNLWVDGKLHGG